MSDANRTEVTSTEIPASERVETFLECVEERRRRSTRFGLTAAAVAGIVTTVAYLTAAGTVQPDPRIVAAAGTLGLGLLIRDA